MILPVQCQPRWTGFFFGDMKAEELLIFLNKETESLTAIKGALTRAKENDVICSAIGKQLEAKRLILDSYINLSFEIIANLEEEVKRIKERKIREDLFDRERIPNKNRSPLWDVVESSTRRKEYLSRPKEEVLASLREEADRIYAKASLLECELFDFLENRKDGDQFDESEPILRTQLMIMCAYKEILTTRICRLEKEMLKEKEGEER